MDHRVVVGTPIVGRQGYVAVQMLVSSNCPPAGRVLLPVPGTPLFQVDSWDLEVARYRRCSRDHWLLP